MAGHNLAGLQVVAAGIAVDTVVGMVVGTVVGMAADKPAGTTVGLCGVMAPAEGGNWGAEEAA